MIIMYMCCHQKVNPEAKIQSLKDSISVYVSRNCSCLFTSNYIVDASLNCELTMPHEVILVGGILSSGETNSTFLRDTSVQNFLNSMDGKVLNVGGTNVTLNSYCSAAVANKGDLRCLAQEGRATSATKAAGSDSALRIGIYVAIGAGVGLFLCFLLVIAAMVLCICCSKREVRSKYKESRNDDFNIK